MDSRGVLCTWACNSGAIHAGLDENQLPLHRYRFGGSVSLGQSLDKVLGKVAATPSPWHQKGIQMKIDIKRSTIKKFVSISLNEKDFNQKIWLIGSFLYFQKCIPELCVPNEYQTAQL